MRDNGTFSINDLFAFVLPTCSSVLSNGKQIVLTNGVPSGDWEVDTKEATIKVKWFSRSVLELVAT